MSLIRELLKSYFILLTILFIGRLFLYLFLFNRFSEINLIETLLSFIYGIRMDSMLLGIIIMPMMLIGTLFPKFIKSDFTKTTMAIIIIIVEIIISNLKSFNIKEATSFGNSKYSRNR